MRLNLLRDCCITSDDPQAMALGKESVFSNGTTLGYLTSADYGYSVGKLVGYAYLPVDYTEQGTEVEIGYLDRRFKAVVSADPQVDLQMEKLKA